METHDLPSYHEMDDKSFLKHILKRPGMYVGADRLDYIQHFAAGFSEANAHRALPAWNANYEIQHWLFRTQCAALNTIATNGWSLFYRCFGNGCLAIGKFAEMLHADIPPYPYPPELHASQASVAGDLKSTSLPCGDEEPLTAAVAGPLVHETIRALLAQASAKYDIVRVYIHSESLCTQIRLIYHTPHGWCDDADILANPRNHQSLLVLHRLAALCPGNEWNRMALHDPATYFHVDDSLASWEPFPDIPQKTAGEETLWCRYQKWRTFFTASY